MQMMQTIIAIQITVIRPLALSMLKPLSFSVKWHTVVVQQRYTSILVDLEQVEF